MHRPPPWIASILKWLVPREQRDDFLADLADRYVSFPTYLYQAGVRIYQTNHSQVIHILMTSWLFDTNRLGIRIVAGALVAGMLELPSEGTQATRVVDQLCGLVTVFSITYWLVFPIHRNAWISALFSVLFLLQLFIAILSAFPNLGVISVDEWSLAIMSLSLLVGTGRNWFTRWRRSQIETVAQFARAAFIAIGRSFRPVSRQAVGIMTVCWLGSLILPEPAPGGPDQWIPGHPYSDSRGPLGNSVSDAWLLQETLLAAQHTVRAFRFARHTVERRVSGVLERHPGNHSAVHPQSDLEPGLGRHHRMPGLFPSPWAH